MGKQKPTNRSCRRELMLKPRNVITLKSGVRERGREREFLGVGVWNENKRRRDGKWGTQLSA